MKLKELFINLNNFMNKIFNAFLFIFIAFKKLKNALLIIILFFILKNCILINT